MLPAVPRVRPLIEEKLQTWSVRLTLSRGKTPKWRAFANADAALAASGTVALELSLAAVPMVLAYRLDPVSYCLRHLMTGWTAALPNFVAGHPLVPEHFHETIQPEHLARRLERLMTPTPERAAQMAGFEAIRSAMTVPEPPGAARRADHSRSRRPKEDGRRSARLIVCVEEPLSRGSPPACSRAARRPCRAGGTADLWCGSSIISFHCAIQPTVRATAKSTVNISVGKPSAFSVMPE